MLTFLLFSLFIQYVCLKYTVRKNHLFCPTYSDSSDLLICQAARPHVPSSLKKGTYPMHVSHPCDLITSQRLQSSPGNKLGGWQRTKTEFEPFLHGFTHHEKTLENTHLDQEKANLFSQRMVFFFIFTSESKTFSNHSVFI